MPVYSTYKKLLSDKIFMEVLKLKAKFMVDGINCTDCASKIEILVKSQKGVEKADLNLATGKLEIDYDPNKITKDNIIEVINRIGYTAEEI